MIPSLVLALKNALHHIPNQDRRARVGIIAVSSVIHFFVIGPEEGDVSVMVVSDISEMFLPVPDNLLVNLTECFGIQLHPLSPLARSNTENRGFARQLIRSRKRCFVCYGSRAASCHETFGLILLC